MNPIRILVLGAAFVLAGTGFTSSAFADSWGCSYDKCLVACNKAGGKYCPKYCDGRLKDKRDTKVCK